MARPAASVILSAWELLIRGHIRSFQVFSMPRMASVVRPGFTSGSSTFQ